MISVTETINFINNLYIAAIKKRSAIYCTHMFSIISLPSPSSL